MKRLIFTMESVGNNCFQNKSNQSFKIGLQIIKPNDIIGLRDSNYSGFKFDLFVNEIKISGFKYDIAGKVFFGDYLNNSLFIELSKKRIKIYNYLYAKDKLLNILNSFRNRNMLFSTLYIITVSLFDMVVRI